MLFTNLKSFPEQIPSVSGTRAEKIRKSLPINSNFICVKYNWRRHTHPHKGAIFDLFWNFAIQTGADLGRIWGGFGGGESRGIVKNYDGERKILRWRT